MAREDMVNQELSEQTREQVLWHENAWANNQLKKFYEKSPLLAKVATRFMNALEYGSREAAAPGPREAASRDYDYKAMNRPEPRLIISQVVGPLVAMPAAIYGFTKGGEIFRALKKKYGLE